MPRLKGLSSLFRSSVKPKAKAKAKAAAATATATVKNSTAMDAALKQYVSSLDISSPSISHSVGKSSVKYPNPPPDPINAHASLAVRTVLPMLKAEGPVLGSGAASLQRRRMLFFPPFIFCFFLPFSF